jgi:guanylate kinase
MPRQGKIFIISGPSGSGKTTLYRKLLQRKRLKNKIVKAISVTTRPMREGEVHGRDYIFVTKESFIQKMKRGDFLEFENVFGNLYGTPQRTVIESMRRGESVILCIDVKGAKTVRRKMKGVVAIFIKTKTLAELKKRLKNRGSESGAKLALRLATAKAELKQAPAYNYIVINDKIRAAVDQLEMIILKEIGKRHK